MVGYSQCIVAGDSKYQLKNLVWLPGFYIAGLAVCAGKVALVVEAYARLYS